ncbi:hypothetical protein [Morganella sp. GD04133]|uniref:hypothetical protein n=1 Tax=Morganella sp. GD04133 TaxID=2975435 RepID=UPI00244713A8|nr:hypothetical protein [Morganella sp. GD04133]MDH0356519.1 hypothetical protein [Morganella sp. GD04133]
MTVITFLPAKENSKTRRLRKQGEFLARKIARREMQKQSRSVEEIFDSVFGRPADETDVFAELIIGLKDAPEAPRKQLRMNRKPIMQDGGITARA